MFFCAMFVLICDIWLGGIGWTNTSGVVISVAATKPFADTSLFCILFLICEIWQKSVSKMLLLSDLVCLASKCLFQLAAADSGHI